jgi:hypothetical protein
VVDAQEQERQIRPDTLPPEALADWFVESRDLPRADSQRSMVEGVVHRAMGIPGDPRAEAVRARLIEEMEITEDISFFGMSASYVLRFAQVNEGWMDSTLNIVLRYVEGPHEMKRFRMLYAVQPAPLEIREPLVPIVSQMLEAVPPRDFRQQRIMLGHLLRLGEPGVEELRRLIAEDRLDDRLVGWIRFTASEDFGPG